MAPPYMNGSMNNSLEQRIGGNFIVRRCSHEKSDQISEHMAVALKRLSIKSSIAVSALRHDPERLYIGAKNLPKSRYVIAARPVWAGPGTILLGAAESPISSQ